MPVKLAAPSASRMPRRSRGGATGPPAPISTNVPAAETPIATKDSGCRASPPIAAYIAANAPCDEIVAETRPTRPYCSAVNSIASPISEPAEATIAHAQAPALASGKPWMSAIGRMTTSPTPKIQARALAPPSARDTRASSTEMLPQVQAVKVARRMPTTTNASAGRGHDGDACEEDRDTGQLRPGEPLAEDEERDHHAH